MKSVLASKTKCGHAHLEDVLTGQMSDDMESFFMAETLKYLFLLLSNTTTLTNAVVFTTEAHVFFPLPSKNDYIPIDDPVPESCHEICRPTSEEQRVLFIAFEKCKKVFSVGRSGRIECSFSFVKSETRRFEAFETSSMSSMCHRHRIRRRNDSG